MCERYNIFEVIRTLIISIPIAFRVLVSLRILEKNQDCDTMCELSLMGALLVTLNFKSLFKTLFANTSMGFNGCIGSIGCTHILVISAENNGKTFALVKRHTPLYLFWSQDEAYPTLYVDHNRRAMVVRDAFLGGCNEKMIVKNVEETKALMSGSM